MDRCWRVGKPGLVPVPNSKPKRIPGMGWEQCLVLLRAFETAADSASRTSRPEQFGFTFKVATPCLNGYCTPARARART